jgi:cold shock protein
VSSNGSVLKPPKLTVWAALAVKPKFIYINTFFICSIFQEEFFHMSERSTGAVKWFNNTKGYGFISKDEGGDVFVHYTSIRGAGFRSLNEGDRVEFTVETGQKGPAAVDVVVLSSTKEES